MGQLESQRGTRAGTAAYIPAAIFRKSISCGGAAGTLPAAGPTYFQAAIFTPTSGSRGPSRTAAANWRRECSEARCRQGSCPAGSANTQASGAAATATAGGGAASAAGTQAAEPG